MYICVYTYMFLGPTVVYTHTKYLLYVCCALLDRRYCQQGCQIFLVQNTKTGEKYTKLPQNISNSRKIFPMAVK
jgi:hypothetical protein